MIIAAPWRQLASLVPLIILIREYWKEKKVLCYPPTGAASDLQFVCTGHFGKSPAIRLDSLQRLVDSDLDDEHDALMTGN